MLGKMQLRSPALDRRQILKSGAALGVGLVIGLRLHFIMVITMMMFPVRVVVPMPSIETFFT